MKNIRCHLLWESHSKKSDSNILGEGTKSQWGLYTIFKYVSWSMSHTWSINGLSVFIYFETYFLKLPIIMLSAILKLNGWCPFIC